MTPKTTSATTQSRRQELLSFFEKIVVNAGIGRISQMSNFEDKILPGISRDLALLSGQKPEVRRARKSIAGFKVREGQIVGLRVTLRRGRMVDFFERFIKIVLPRLRDFHGIPLTAVDEAGVLNIGLKEQLVFPEVPPEQASHIFSLGVSLVPKDRNRTKAIEEYRRLGVPLKYPSRQ